MDYRPSDRTLAVGTHSRGAFTTQIPDLPTNVEADRLEPTSFALEQNYPNPFNPTTTISYSVAFPVFVSIKVFDLAGKEVATLVEGNESVGVHTAQLDASALSSGVYFYRLSAGSFRTTRKMVLLR